jgi:hypothetical protein
VGVLRSTARSKQFALLSAPAMEAAVVALILAAALMVASALGLTVTGA